MIVTNLRIMWTSAKSARTNLSIGLNCMTGVSIRLVNSKLRGNSQAMFVMTRFNSTRFEFIFTSLVKNSPRLFTTVQAVFKNYEALSRLEAARSHYPRQGVGDVASRAGLRKDW